MKSPVSSIRNLGPAFEKSCAQAGIHDAEHLRRLGPEAAYAKLLQSGMKPHFIGYYDCKGAEKTALRATFDALKAEHANPASSEFERMMNVIGIRAP